MARDGRGASVPVLYRQGTAPPQALSTIRSGRTTSPESSALTGNRMTNTARDAAPPAVDISPQAEAATIRVGQLELRHLAWDTRFFGATMGTIALAPVHETAPALERSDLLYRDLVALLDRARARGYAHLILRIPGDDMPSVWAAERADLRLVDVGVDSTFSFGRTVVPESSTAALVRPVRDNDLPALRELAAAAFVFSRFAADPFFTPTQVADFHREWVTNLCRGLAQAVLVCEVEGVPAGFVSCSYHRGGLGRALVSEALRWFDAAGVRVAHVKTQAQNYPALALYQRSGFVVSNTEFTFSAALD
jgi:dTDP-4-amino-4,6-dideoxy-D-galactose acyltransferase